MASVGGWCRVLGCAYTRCLRRLVWLAAAAAFAAVTCMMVLTTADVLLRRTPWPLVGVYDVVGILGGLAMVCALPYTTAVKGHIAVEYFFHKLARRGRLAVDTAARLTGILLFVTLSLEMWLYAAKLAVAGQVTLTLQIPASPVIRVAAVMCGLTALVILHNLLHPGREMIKP